MYDDDDYDGYGRPMNYEDYAEFMRFMNSLLAPIQEEETDQITVTDNVFLHVLGNPDKDRVQFGKNVLNKLATKMPYKNGNVNVYYPWNMDEGDAETDIRDPDRIMHLNPEMFTPEEDKKKYRYTGLRMPFFYDSNVTNPEYVIVHEWGHVIDERPLTAKSHIETVLKMEKQGLLVNPKFSNSLSRYGHSGEKEAWAETFTEWFLTNGETDNFAAKWYAKEYGWKFAN